MNRIKISDSDKRLLLIFCAIVIVACSYFFIFSKGMSKAAKIEEQNTADQAKVQQMEQMEAGLPKVKENIQRMVKKQKTIISTYPSAMTTEKAIESLQAYEDNSSDFHITDITFTMNQPVAVDVQTDGTDTAAGTDASSTTASDADAAEQETAGPEPKEVRGYYASIGIRYEAGYAGLKEMIAYVNNFKDRTTISQFTANYDDSTGKLNGEMTLNMYYLENTGKEYVPPVFPNMSKGVMSIFGRSTSLETAP